MATRDPGTGETIAEFCVLDAADVDAAVKAANHAFKHSGWATLPPNERGVHIHRLADALEKHKPIIGQIEALDAGKILGQALGDVQNCVDTLRYFADMAMHVQRRNVLAVAGHEAWTTRNPWGACGFIFPWNFPLLLIGWGISPALAAGNTAVIKPAEDTPLSAIYLARLARETGLFPVFEAERGEVTAVTKIRHRVPVEEYLRPQKRFAHIFGSKGHPQMLERIQAQADRNIRRFGLLEDDQ